MMKRWLKDVVSFVLRVIVESIIEHFIVSLVFA